MSSRTFNLSGFPRLTALIVVLPAILLSADTAAGVVLNTTQVNMTWKESASTDLVGYNVFRASRVTGPFSKLNDSLLSSNSFIDISVQDKHTYYYVVTARDLLGNESEPQVEFLSEQVRIDLAAKLDDDMDNDSLADVVEDFNGNGRVDFSETDPGNSDTDGDGINDGDEDANFNGYVEAGETDPRRSDTDGDGISDRYEQISGTNSLSFDTDGDGYSDAVDTDPLDAAVTGDTDGDGFPDLFDDAPADPAVFAVADDQFEPNDDLQNLPASSEFGATEINAALEAGGSLATLVADAWIVENDVDYYLIDTTSVSEGEALLFEVWTGAGDRVDVHLYRADTLETVDAAYYVRQRRLDLQLAGHPTSIVPGAALTFPAGLAADGVPVLLAVEASFAGDDGDNLFGGTQDYTIRMGVAQDEALLTDSDGDGLTDTEEWSLHTDARLADTDFDGLNDGDETVLGTEPTLFDTDGDGLSDGDDLFPTDSSLPAADDEGEAEDVENPATDDIDEPDDVSDETDDGDDSSPADNEQSDTGDETEVPQDDSDEIETPVPDDGDDTPPAPEETEADNSNDDDDGYPSDPNDTEPGPAPDQPDDTDAVGDVNDDFVINAIDVQLVINAVLGLNVSYPDESTDLDHDARYTAVDIQIVINSALGII